MKPRLCPRCRKRPLAGTTGYCRVCKREYDRIRTYGGLSKLADAYRPKGKD